MEVPTWLLVDREYPGPPHDGHDVPHGRGYLYHPATLVDHPLAGGFSLRASNDSRGGEGPYLARLPILGGLLSARGGWGAIRGRRIVWCRGASLAPCALCGPRAPVPVDLGHCVIFHPESRSPRGGGTLAPGPPSTLPGAAEYTARGSRGLCYHTQYHAWSPLGGICGRACLRFNGVVSTRIGVVPKQCLGSQIGKPLRPRPLARCATRGGNGGDGSISPG